MKGTRLAILGLCFVATLIICVVSFLRTIPVREVYAKSACLAIMKQIEGAKETWVAEHHKTTNDIPRWADLVGPDGYLREIPRCPHGGAYAIGIMTEPPLCSNPKCNDYFRESMPSYKTGR